MAETTWEVTEMEPMNEVSTVGDQLLTESYEMTPSEGQPGWVTFLEGLATGIGTTLAAGTATWFLTKKGREERRKKEIDERVEEMLRGFGLIKSESILDEEAKTE